MKKRLATVLAALILVAATTAQTPPPASFTIQWDPPAATDNVSATVVAYRARGSTATWAESTVPVPATTFVIPADASATEFRAAHVNPVGRSAWTAIFWVPKAPKVRVVWEQ